MREEKTGVYLRTNSPTYYDLLNYIPYDTVRDKIFCELIDIDIMELLSFACQ